VGEVKGIWGKNYGGGNKAKKSCLQKITHKNLTKPCHINAKIKVLVFEIRPGQLHQDPPRQIGEKETEGDIPMGGSETIRTRNEQKPAKGKTDRKNQPGWGG